MVKKLSFSFLSILLLLSGTMGIGIFIDRPGEEGYRTSGGMVPGLKTMTMHAKSMVGTQGYQNVTDQVTLSPEFSDYQILQYGDNAQAGYIADAEGKKIADYYRMQDTDPAPVDALTVGTIDGYVIYVSQGDWKRGITGEEGVASIFNVEGAPIGQKRPTFGGTGFGKGPVRGTRAGFKPTAQGPAQTAGTTQAGVGVHPTVGGPTQSITPEQKAGGISAGLGPQ